MADSLFLWTPDFWIYNHGKFGASDHIRQTVYAQPIEVMTGINKLFGDGHVEWKSNLEFDPDLVNNINPLGAVPRINAGYGGFIYY